MMKFLYWAYTPFLNIFRLFMFKDTKFLWLVSLSLLVTLLEFFAFLGFRIPFPFNLLFFSFLILSIGSETLKNGLKSLLKLDFKSINTLMLIAVAGAFYLGQYEEAAVVICLYTLAEKLEDIGMEKSQSAMKDLVEKMPKTAFLKGSEHPIPVTDIKTGDVLQIKPSNMIPLDGKITFGSSYVNEATITGESIPQDKFVGDFVYAGTLNGHGYLEIQVEKEIKDTVFSKIQQLTLEASQLKAPTQQFIEDFSQYYTPFVIFLALAWVIVPVIIFGAPLEDWLSRALSLIVIACPCALVISTPVAIYSALGNASKKGILIKGGAVLEHLGKLKVMALDKTGTLTTGNPLVTDIIPMGSSTKEDLLACAGGIEIFSEHPLAQSIVKAAKNQSIPLHTAENFRNIIGKGVQADCLVCQDEHHCIGKLPFILEEHTVPSEVLEIFENLQTEGKTSIIIATHKEVKGIIALTDQIREESFSFIQELKKLNIHSLILTGDQISSATSVAQQLGINEVHAGLLPQDKALIVKDLVNTYRFVGMVGDGVNDAPALALSTVGISFKTIGSDTAVEAASVIILNDRLDLIPFLIKLGKKTLRTIQVNTALAIGIKFLFIALALAGFMNLGLAIFADVGITLIVILISLRLLK